MPRKDFGDFLLELGAITPMQLRAAQGEQRRFGQPLSRVVVDMEMMDEQEMVNVLSHHLNLPAVQLSWTSVQHDAISMLPKEFCLKHSCMPFRYQPAGKFLDVAMSDPTDQQLFDLIRVQTHCNVRPYLAGFREISRAISEAHGDRAVEPSIANDRWSHGVEISLGEEEQALGNNASDTPAVSLPLEPIGLPSAHERSTAPPADFQLPKSIPTRAELRALQQEVETLSGQLQHTQRALRNLVRLLLTKGTVSNEDLSMLFRSD